MKNLLDAIIENFSGIRIISHRSSQYDDAGPCPDLWDASIQRVLVLITNPAEGAPQLGLGSEGALTVAVVDGMRPLGLPSLRMRSTTFLISFRVPTR